LLVEYKVRCSDVTPIDAGYLFLLPGTGTTQPGQAAGSPAAAFAAAKALAAGTGNGLVQNGATAPQAQQQAGQGQQQAGQGQQQAGQGQQVAQGQQQNGIYVPVIHAEFLHSDTHKE
jgi:hypothetical protein